MLIGDAALKNLGATEYSLDLGAEWHELTGLPFVYACWVARGDVELGDVPNLLLEAKNRGVTQIPEIARIEAEKTRFNLKTSVKTTYNITSTMTWMNRK